MNHIFRSLWNASSGTFVAASEIAKTGGKKSSATAGTGFGGSSLRGGFALKTLTCSLLLAFGLPAYALPVNGVVAAGNASIAAGAGNLTITQTSQNAALNWQSFNIGAAEAVKFVQPNSSSVALNRVLGSDPSSILGSLTANGKVFLVNPNGIVFGKGASVNVGGLVASTRDILNSDFMAGRYKFDGSGNGAVLNQGTINAADGGYVALLGANVSNEGVIAARLGTVALAAGKAMTLDVAGDGLLNIAIDQGAVNALVHNGGLIKADGGQVFLTAQTAGNLLHTAVNNTGVIQAQTLQNRNGVIKLLGDMQSGTVNVGGTLDASAPDVGGGGNGGFIETSAAHVNIADGVKVTTAAANGQTGSWLIDPTDFTIAAGSGTQTDSSIGATTLQNALVSTDVSIATSANPTGSELGDININSAVAWSANKLTLTAHHDININAVLSATGVASLDLEPASTNVNVALGGSGFTGRVDFSGTGALTINNNVQTVISDVTKLQAMTGNLTGHYALGSSFDGTVSGGFTPVGNYNNQFSGTFDGLGHTVSNLTISSPGDYVGLFGSVATGATVRNVGLIGASVSGNSSVGGLVGYNNGTISNSYATGSVVSGTSNVGGLVGVHNIGTVSNSYATGSVIGTDNVGGLVGSNFNYGSISNSYATSSVSDTGTGTGTVGGLVGHNFGTVNNSYATGAVSGSSYVGGLVGYNTGSGSISNSYATGAVWGRINAGGLVGVNYGSGSISNSYATGAVSGGYRVGGLVGYNSNSISNSYATGAVSGSSINAGGLVGANYSNTISNSYWNTNVIATGIGSGPSTGATGLTTLEMQTASNFTGFNFTTTPGATGNNWVMVDVDGTLNNAGSSLGATRPMLASEYSTTINNAHQLQLMTMNLAGSYTLGANIDAARTGTANDVWSGSTFIPVGNLTTNFTGTFDGLGHTISNLTINRPTTNDVGLFGFIDATSAIRNVGMVGGSVTGNLRVGGLVGYNGTGTISNSYATGAVTGSNYAGGLVGYNGTGTISNSYATGAVSASSWNGGGLVGINQGGKISNSYATGTVYSNNTAGGLVGANNNTNNGGGTISNSYATGAVTGSNNVGGLVGSVSNGGTISNSYATGAVTGSSNNVGGLVGRLYNSTISNSYATGAVSGVNDVGGLVGYDVNNSTISNSYATGAVSGTTNVGGLAGWIGGGGSTISNSYATGAVSGTTNVGGLVGYNDGTGSISNSYWDTTTSGQATSAGGTGRTTTEMKDQANKATNFAGFDFTTTPVWGFSAGGNSGYPVLCAFGGCVSLVITVYVGPVTGSSIYGTAPVFTYTLVDSTGAAYSLTDATITGTATYSSAPTATSIVGNYLFSYGNGFTLTGTGASNYLLAPWATKTAWTVNKAPLTVTANAASKSYNGLAYSGGNGVAYTGFVNNETSAVFGGTLAYGGTSQGAINAASYTLTPSGYTSGNYSLSYANGALTVNKAAATVTANSGTGTYSGVSQSVSGFTASGLVNGEATTVLNGVTAAGVSGTNAGTYASTASGTDGNYSLSFVNGNLVIGKAAATVTANSGTGTYSGVSQSVSGFTASGLVNNESTSVLTGVTAGGSGTNANTYTSIASGTDGNYTLSFVNGNLVIGKAAATVTANSGTGTYSGVSQSVSGFTASGLVNGEATTVLNGVTAGGSGTNAGSYASTASGTDGNYTLTFVNGNLVIGKAAATVTANSGTGTYSGVSQSVSGFTASGLVNNESTSVLTGVTAAGGSGTNAGSYTSIASGTDGNYSLSFVNGTLTIAKAQLTVTADNQTKVVGAANPTLTETITGFVNNETSAVVNGTASGTSTAGFGTGVGTATIAANATGLSAANYAFSTLVDGVLTIKSSANPAIDGAIATAAALTASVLVEANRVEAQPRSETQRAVAYRSKDANPNDLKEINLEIINHGIKLPPGIKLSALTEN
ncbi:MAG: GLUG motif-containing protein [Burkholderiaceae bacterium]